MKGMSLTAAKNAVVVLLFTLVLGVKANASPAIKIVLPERFRVLSQQLFDLRIEVVGLTDSAAQLQIVVNDGNKHDALQGLNAPEVTTNNDNDPASREQ